MVNTGLSQGCTFWSQPRIDGTETIFEEIHSGRIIRLRREERSSRDPEEEQHLRDGEKNQNHKGIHSGPKR